MSKQKRTVKSKKDIVSDLHQIQDATRRRALISEVVFPYLVSIDENIGYSKVFLQSMSGLINGEYEEMRKKTTVGEIHDRLITKLNSIFAKSDPIQKIEYDRYLGLIEQLKEVSVQDFTYAAELPRYIDGLTTKTEDKKPISTVDIKTILG